MRVTQRHWWASRETRKQIQLLALAAVPVVLEWLPGSGQLALEQATTAGLAVKLILADLALHAEGQVSQASRAVRSHSPAHLTAVYASLGSLR